ncbi:glyoxalase/bleomycin resistance/dioxygenase family protein [Mycobacterium kansasii]|uniref:VOC domain-containing protein n=2 Tax=Mycobacterium kansasii TaxID=1768 RepID=A0A7G1IE23_MYCKA|nr:glyoxalase/bleomycin resistance/dioxygenase family protein [Mycobacterium kansasii]EUA20283.1 glyoxalase/Bleomycin resistance /Dioxygenase superfamily protein [Mycobacterium kansasii 662]ARG63750.1 glyoxalase/bleomycin resistance/dioxygenase family protein [Mycobacterium kansasii]ARG71395.1 glyoxalase/bleomycin resistance/dioxygenase family protein [Mycobacterium kansasii]ARG79513.1 glyoxalase/bleomycin resistance/dioxygenase family protein [Mycobacterium kansasii]
MHFVLGVHHAAICTANVESSLRFWRDGLGLTELFDHTFTGNWPELFGAKADQLRSIFLGDPQTPDCGIVELVELFGADEALPAPRTPRHGFFLLSLQRDVDATLSALAALGFADGVRRISMPAPAGKTVPMAVVIAPDGVLVELIGPAV